MGDNRTPSRCEITTIDRLPTPVLIMFAEHGDAEGVAYTMPSSFRLFLAGTNVAGIKGDTIVTGTFGDKPTAWVVAREAWDPVKYPSR